MSSSTDGQPNGPSGLESFLQAKTWIDMNPRLSVADPERRKNPAVFQIDESAGNSLETLILREGYFHIPQLPWKLPLTEMAQAIVRIADHGLVPPFCFIYDEFWLMFLSLYQMLSRLLGANYAMLPDFWAWYVDPRAGASGWKPHRDKGHGSLFPDKRPKSLTVWIPLTEATPLNGCIYIVPAHLDPTYNTPQDDQWRFAHQDIRALPSAAGGLFMWTQAVIHWGSRSSPLAAGPRISLAFEFQRGDVPPMNQPLIPPSAFLSFDQRLKLICKQILQYEHMYPLKPQLKRFAKSAFERAPGGADHTAPAS